MDIVDGIDSTGRGLLVVSSSASNSKRLNGNWAINEVGNTSLEVVKVTEKVSFFINALGNLACWTDDFIVTDSEPT